MRLAAVSPATAALLLASSVSRLTLRTGGGLPGVMTSQAASSWRPHTTSTSPRPAPRPPVTRTSARAGVATLTLSHASALILSTSAESVLAR